MGVENLDSLLDSFKGIIVLIMVSSWISKSSLDNWVNMRID
jgi:hypothetical protein